MEGMWKSILEALTCIYCREYLRAPVRQCLEGHLVCPTCIKKVRNCPQCKSHFITTRNRGIEQIAEVMLYPCVNSSFGCTEKMDKNNKEKHEKDCRLRNVSCLWSKCTWTGSRLYLEEHLNVTHAKYFIKSSDQVLNVSLMNGYSEIILLAYDEYFRVCFDKRQNGVFGYVVCCGSNEKAEQFLFKIGLHGGQEGVYTNMFVCNTYPRDSEIKLNRRSVFFLDERILMRHRGKKNINVRVTVCNSQCEEEQHSENNTVRQNSGTGTDKESNTFESLEKLFRTAANGQVRALRKGNNSEGLMVGGPDMEEFLTELVETTEDVFTDISNFGNGRPMWWYLSVFAVAEELWKAKAKERQLQADYLILQLSQSTKESAMILAGSVALCSAVAQWAAVDMAIKVVTDELKRYGNLPNAVIDSVRNLPYKKGVMNLLSRSNELGGRSAVRKAINRLNQATVEMQRPSTSLLEILKDSAPKIDYNLQNQ